MKNKNLHIGFSILLLVVVWSSQVGLHLFHQHEKNHIEVSSKNASSMLVQEEAGDCLLCNLASFQEISVVAYSIFVFGVLTVQSFYIFNNTTVFSFTLFNEGRGPPVLLF